MTQMADRAGLTPSRPPFTGHTGAELPAPEAVSPTRPTPAGLPRKPAKKARPKKQQRLFQMTILDLTGSPPALKGWPVPVRYGARTSLTERTPFRNGRMRGGQPHNKGD